MQGFIYWFTRMTLYVLVAILILTLVVLNRWLSGEDLSHLDQAKPAPIIGDPPSPANAEVAATVRGFTAASNGGGGLGRSRIAAMREAMDAIGSDRVYASEIRPTFGAAPRGEWVMAPGCDPRRRLLYIHGGAFVAGSPKSHRIITDRLARDTGGAVLSLDYRLMPEHNRDAMLEDCVNAYQWLLDNGPEGSAPLTAIAIAGDSAGGCLTLATLAHAKAQGWRAPEGAVAISPVTDMTLTAPSLFYNRHTDLLLGPSFGQLIRPPAMLRKLIFAVFNRRSPASPVLSPLRGELNGLAPTLIQVSSHEMLLDDAHRYHRRASEAGSPTTLQCFANMVHVWHIFSPQLPEAEFAFEQIKQFLTDCGFVADSHSEGSST